jgi:DNA polymerase-3 subunit gamma/tau
MDLFKQADNAKSLGEAIRRVMGERYAIRARCATTTAQQKSMAEQLLKKAQNSNIELAVDNKTI